MPYISQKIQKLFVSIILHFFFAFSTPALHDAKTQSCAKDRDRNYFTHSRDKN